MLFPSIVLLAASAAASWTIPEGQPNRVYSVQTDSTGASQHTLLTSSISTSTKPKPRSAKFHPKRDNSGQNNIGCGGYSLVESDTGTAAHLLINQCTNGAFVGGGQDYYSLTGGTVAYYCNYSGNTNQCYASEALDAYDRINAECGDYNAG